VIGRQQRDAAECYPAVADNECLLANDTAVGGVERLQLETVGAPAEQKAEICPDDYPSTRYLPSFFLDQDFAAHAVDQRCFAAEHSDWKSSV